MSFSVRLAADSYEVDPGSSVSVAVEVQNLSDEKDHFELALEGLEHHWTAVPVPSFSIDPGETRVERFFLKPPRDTDSSAGNYPFVVRVRSLESGDAESAQANLVINPYFHLSLEVSPRKMTVTPLKRVAEAAVTVVNLGNVEQTVQLFANDVDDAFAYEFEEDHVTLAAGQQRQLTLAATATKSGAFAPSRLHVVTASCRNVENPAYAATTQVQVEQRPLLSPGALAAFAGVLLIIFLWVLNIPKDPTISLTVDRPSVVAGESVTVHWQSEHAMSVTLKIGETEVTGLRPQGEYTYETVTPGELPLSVIALGSGRESVPVTRTLEVTAPEVAPEPEIFEFTTEKQTIPINQAFIVEYRVSPGVTSLSLEPYGALTLDLNRVTIPGVASPGKRTYRLIAKNADGKEVTEDLTLNFVQVVDAKIVRFEANPVEVDALDGRVTLIWQFANTVSATLEYGTQEIQIDPIGSRRDFLIAEDTTFTITAYDTNGLTATKTITVKVKQPPQPDPDQNTTGGDGTDGGTPPPNTIGD